MLRRLYEGPANEGRQERPTGVSLIAVLCFVSALLVAYYSLSALFALAGGAAGTDNGGALTQMVFGAGLTALLLTIASGLWRLKPWAKWLAVGSLIVAVVVIAADALARYGLGSGLSTALSLSLSRSIAPLGMALYLLHPSIAKAFRM